MSSLETQQGANTNLCRGACPSREPSEGGPEVVAVQLQLLQSRTAQCHQPDTLHQGLEANASDGSENMSLRSVTMICVESRWHSNSAQELPTKEI